MVVEAVVEEVDEAAAPISHRFDVEKPPEFYQVSYPLPKPYGNLSSLIDEVSYGSRA